MAFLVLFIYFISSIVGSAPPPTNPPYSTLLQGDYTLPVDLQDSYGTIPSSVIRQTKLNVLLPATHIDVNLCKTMLGLAVLGYPPPLLLGWGDQAMRLYSIHEGSHILTKITKQLEYLETMLSSGGNGDELVLLVDGFDVWFQLRAEVLLSRYHFLNRAANARLRKSLGRRAVKAGDIQQTVIFGAAKVCSNQPHTIGCFPAPEPYTPKDMFGGNTDTVMGRTPNSSKRPRYLASGFMLGPARDLRAILRRAQLKVDHLPEFDKDLDNGSGTSDFLYHGDDTSLFARIFGEQEYQREALRRNHSAAATWSLGLIGPKGPDIESTRITDEGMMIKDVLSPSFTHEQMPRPTSLSRRDAAKEFEFGIGLDYGNDISMQTHDAERDFAYLVYSNFTGTLGEAPKELAHQQEENKPMRKEDPKTIKQQIEHAWPGRNMFDCKPRIREDLPKDLMLSRIPYHAAPKAIFTTDGGLSPQDAPSNTSWEEVRLYTNICLGSIPAIIHHNGDRGLLERDWEKMWWHQWGSTLLEMEKIDRSKDPNSPGVGAWSDKGGFIGWNDLCPKDFDKELYRGMEFD